MKIPHVLKFSPFPLPHPHSAPAEPDSCARVEQTVGCDVNVHFTGALSKLLRKPNPQSIHACAQKNYTQMYAQ